MIRTCEVDLPDKAKFNLEDYKNTYRGLLIALNKDKEPIGYIQLVAGEYYYFCNNDGESTNDSFGSVAELMRYYNEIDSLELIKFV